jgi:fatty acid CoA ligase FadD9
VSCSFVNAGRGGYEVRYGYHLPDRQRQHSLLPLLHRYRKPDTPVCGSLIPTQRFRTAVLCAKIGLDKDIPHVTPEIIVKYVADLELL